LEFFFTAVTQPTCPWGESEKESNTIMLPTVGTNDLESV
jgi:hypothetical protein